METHGAETHAVETHAVRLYMSHEQGLYSTQMTHIYTESISTEIR